jgi:acyl carrier protein
VSTHVLSRVSATVADIFQLRVEDIRPETSPDTIEAWDSLQHLNLVLALEQEFGIQFTPEEIEQLLSVELIADLLAEKLQPSGVS